jgi:gamma-glutamylcyclotransferase (GGCT)/AIG2-like uncharacterized protein YtfP
MKDGVNPLLNRSNDTIFVYGTLKRNSNSEMHRFLAKHAEFVGTAGYCGKLYKIDNYPGVVPSEDPTDEVHGEVYLIRHADVVLPRLDQYEECGPGFPEPHEYCRRKLKVCLGNGDTVMAWVYLYNHSTEGLPLMESADF